MRRLKKVFCLVAVMLFSANSAFAGRYYMPDVGRWATPDPMAMKMPSWSPYSYTFDNPLKYIDQDGRIPILPLLAKVGAGGAADLLAQAAMNYYFDPNVSSASDAFASVNYWQVGRSSAEGLIPWRTPGGRLGRAAATAAGDVVVNALNAGSGYSQEQALKDFATGFIGDLAGGGIGELVSRYGGKSVASGLARLNFDAGSIRSLTGHDVIGDYANNLVGAIGGSVKKASGDGYTVVSGKYTVRIMYSGGQRNSPYIRISKGGKGAIDASGRFSSDRAATHINFTGDPTELIQELIRRNEGS